MICTMILRKQFRTKSGNATDAQHFQRCANKLATKIEALHKTNSRMLTTKFEVDELKELILPKGVRSFNLSYDLTLLDSAQADTSIR